MHDELSIFAPAAIPNGADFYLTPNRNWELEQVPKTRSALVTSRMISRFGLWFSGSLTLTLASRLIPGLLPAYLLSLGAIGVGVTVYAVLSRRTDTRIDAILIAGLVLSGAIGGLWDALWAIALAPVGSFWALQAAIVVLALGLAIGFSWLIQQGSDRR